MHQSQVGYLFFGALAIGAAIVLTIIILKSRDKTQERHVHFDLGSNQVHVVETDWQIREKNE